MSLPPDWPPEWPDMDAQGWCCAPESCLPLGYVFMQYRLPLPTTVPIDATLDELIANHLFPFRHAKNWPPESI